MKEQILDFVRDHWKHFGAYPMEVETDDEILTWDQYWSYITEQEALEHAMEVLEEEA